MIILDEDVIFSQRRLLESFKIHFRQIGVEIGHSGMKDLNEVIPLLHQLKFPTFLLSIMGSIILDLDIPYTASSTLMYGTMKQRNTFAGF